MSAWAVTTANSALEFDTTVDYWNSCCKIDDNHFINFWTGGVEHGWVQTFAVNTSTWAVTTAAKSLEFDTRNGYYHSCAEIDDTHFINFWRGGASSYGYAQVFTVNTSTWAVTTANASLNFTPTTVAYNSCVKVDANHFINFWQDVSSGDGFVQSFTVNTTTWAVTTANSALEFETDNNLFNTCCQIDATHYLNFWQGVDADGFAQVFTVNTTTWAVTTAASSLEFDTRDFKRPSRTLAIDANHFIISWGGNNNYIYSQVFAVNTSTWAVTTAGSIFTVTTQIFNYYRSDLAPIDDNHFLISFAGADDDGYAQVLAVNTSTWAVTTAAAALEYDTQEGNFPCLAQIDTSHFINFWSGVDSDGFVQTFAVELGGGGPANLKTLNTNAKSNIKTINTVAIASVKSYNTIT